MLLKTVKKLRIPCRLKEKLYLLVIISGDLIFYKNGVIRIKTELVELRIERRIVVISFNILLLRNNEAVLEIL